EQFTAKDGLSGPLVVTILEDREGNIWCGTTNGLDRFRQGAFLTVDLPHPDLPRAILATKDGSLWTEASPPVGTVRVGPHGEKEMIASRGSRGMCEDETGALWSLEGADFFHTYRLRQGRFAPVPLPGGLVLKGLSTITCDHAGGVWLFDSQQGLFRLTA